PRSARLPRLAGLTPLTACPALATLPATGAARRKTGDGVGPASTIGSRAAVVAGLGGRGSSVRALGRAGDATGDRGRRHHQDQRTLPYTV
ncbi:hypothetical protein PV703_32195, partial [Streptomyces sp. ME01-24h]|nr:hypothetical protein [Streptomyces sp. ME01-24h]